MGERVVPPLVEPIYLKDIFATGRDIEFNPDFVRIVYWTEHPASFGDHGLPPTERHAVCKIIMPRRTFAMMRARAVVANMP